MLNRYFQTSQYIIIFCYIKITIEEEITEFGGRPITRRFLSLKAAIRFYNSWIYFHRNCQIDNLHIKFNRADTTMTYTLDSLKIFKSLAISSVANLPFQERNDPFTRSRTRGIGVLEKVLINGLYNRPATGTPAIVENQRIKGKLKNLLSTETQSSSFRYSFPSEF